MIKSRLLLCETVRTRGRNEAGHTLVSEVGRASHLVETRDERHKTPVAKHKSKTDILRRKRLELLELGRRIPNELKSKTMQNNEKKIAKINDMRPDQIQRLYRYASITPPKRQYAIRNSFCSNKDIGHVKVHPLWKKRWWELMKSTPQGVLRHHMRELIPILEDRMRASRFQDYFDSTEIDILRRKGWVFNGRDGEPLKLTLEELRQKREADLFKPLDPTVDKAVKWSINRRKENKQHKSLSQHPTYKPASYNEGDVLAYLAWRSFPIYSVMMRIFSDIVKRAPQFVPRSMLDFGSGFGTSIFSAVEIWKGIPNYISDSTGLAHVDKLNLDVLGKRGFMQHPMHTEEQLKSIISDLAEKEAESLTHKLEDVKLKVEQGLLPSGSEIELADDIQRRSDLKNDNIWDSAATWKTDDFANDNDLDEEFLGEGMYSGKTKEFEETDYFLEKDHSQYPLPDFAKDLNEKDLSPNDYIQWFNVRNDKAAAYYKHVEKAKLERDPTYRPLSAMQYLQSKSEVEQSDSSLESSKLHQESIASEDHPVVYGKSKEVWDNRKSSVLSTIRAIEPSKAMVDSSLDMLMDVAPEVDYRKLLPDGEHASSKNDLVVCSYTLSELKSEKLRQDAIRSLWQHCSGILVIVEQGTPTGFKLVQDARETILSEYSEIGPWESQPTVLAPCQHDLRCPVAHSIKGHQDARSRVCASNSLHQMSAGQIWALGSKGKEVKVGDEKYSYCVLARRDVIPAKSLRTVSNYKSTIISEKEGIKDQRVEEILNDKDNLWRYFLNRKRLSDDEINQYENKYLEVPENDMNFLHKQSNSKRTLRAEELAALHKETADYLKEYRDMSWSWNRVVSKAGDSFLRVCTPHGSLDEVTVDKNNSHGRSIRSYVAGDALVGGLLPDVFQTRRELIQSDASNTLAPVKKDLNPLRAATLEEREKEFEKEQSSDDLVDEFGEEQASWYKKQSDALETASNDPKGPTADSIRKEIINLRRDMGDALKSLGVSPLSIK